jgi:SPX domain protein involved in polyphosphate accumulation
MRFSVKLQSTIYEPWKGHYIAYTDLKTLLYEGQSEGQWGESNESRFVERLDSELEKVSKSIVYMVLNGDICLSTSNQRAIGD